MDPSSAPSLDGFIGAEVDAAIRFFFRTGMMVLGLNSIFMVLIPNFKESSTIVQFYPIVVSNFLHKIITKFISKSVGCYC